MDENIQKWEFIEERIVFMVASKYSEINNLSCKIDNYGYRNKGLELDVTKIDIQPDFVLRFQNKDSEITVIKIEAQGMKPDYNQFHIKKHNIDIALKTGAYFIHASGIGKSNERYVVISPFKLRGVVNKSIEKFGVVGFPGTSCSDFPEGKPCYRFLDEWFEWNYTNSISGKLIIH
mgnify:CR=1 FL=1